MPEKRAQNRAIDAASRPLTQQEQRLSSTCRRTKARYGLRAVRVGEASQPGPPASLKTPHLAATPPPTAARDRSRSPVNDTEPPSQTQPAANAVPFSSSLVRITTFLDVPVPRATISHMGPLPRSHGFRRISYPTPIPIEHHPPFLDLSFVFDFLGRGLEWGVGAGCGV